MPKGREYEYATKKDLNEKLDYDDFDMYLNDPETGSRAIFKDHEKRLKGLEKKSRNFKR